MPKVDFAAIMIIMIEDRFFRNKTQSSRGCFWTDFVSLRFMEPLAGMGRWHCGAGQVRSTSAGANFRVKTPLGLLLSTDLTRCKKRYDLN